MTYPVTAGSRQLVQKLRGVVDQIDDGALRRLSVEARAEWHGFVRRLPSQGELSSGSIALSEEDASSLLAKAIRFSEIVASAYQGVDWPRRRSRNVLPA
jgi:hypothetical protein